MGPLENTKIENKDSHAPFIGKPEVFVLNTVRPEFTACGSLNTFTQLDTDIDCDCVPEAFGVHTRPGNA